MASDVRRRCRINFRACHPSRLVLHRAPDAFGGGEHRHAGDAERSERVEVRVHDDRRRGDGAAFADVLDAERVCRARDRAEVDRGPGQCVGARRGPFDRPFANVATITTVLLWRAKGKKEERKPCKTSGTSFWTSSGRETQSPSQKCGTLGLNWMCCYSAPASKMDQMTCPGMTPIGGGTRIITADASASWCSRCLTGNRAG